MKISSYFGELKSKWIIQLSIDVVGVCVCVCGWIINALFNIQWELSLLRNALALISILFYYK